nr:MAG TPA: dCTP deaminase dUTPase [Caudoviricetes sp.]
MNYTAPYKLTKKHGDQGWDIQSTEEIVLKPRETYTFPTGVRIEFHPGVAAYVVPRSGLSSKGILCHLGLVDSSYRGEIGVNLTNLGDEDYKVEAGDRIGQLVFFEEKNMYLIPVKEVDCDTDRGTKGFGSSGR